MRRVLVGVLLAGLVAPGVAGAAMPPPVQIVATACPWAPTRPGCTAVGTHVVYWGDADPMTLLHEIGHQLDYWVLTDADRNRFRALMHDRRPWRAPGGDSPHERFAEAFAWCRMYPRALPDGDGPAYSFRPRPGDVPEGVRAHSVCGQDAVSTPIRASSALKSDRVLSTSVWTVSVKGW